MSPSSKRPSATSTRSARPQHARALTSLKLRNAVARMKTNLETLNHSVIHTTFDTRMCLKRYTSQYIVAYRHLHTVLVQLLDTSSVCGALVPTDQGTLRATNGIVINTIPCALTIREPRGLESSEERLCRVMIILPSFSPAAFA